MGNLTSRRTEKGQSEPVENDSPPIDREGTKIEDKEVAMGMRMMKENMRLKQIEANDPDLLQTLLRPRSTEEKDGTYEYDPVVLPTDADGYVRSFDVNTEAKKARASFDRFGVVVFRNVAAAKDCSIARDELWSFLERHNKSIDRKDPHTWESWTSLKALGFSGDMPILSPHFFEIRQSPSVHRCFATLFRDERLFVNVGRAGIMRPTRAVRFEKDGHIQTVDKPEWKTLDPQKWIHWDMNPFTGATTTYGWRAEDFQRNCTVGPNAHATYTQSHDAFTQQHPSSYA